MDAPTFLEALAPYGVDLSPACVDVLQVNITRMCNQACVHCHVDASPDRREEMSAETIADCLRVLELNDGVRTLDVTGGAPELHPLFEQLVTEARALRRTVIVRHNLTVTLDPHPASGRSMEHLPEFFAAHGVELVCSLPCYEPESTDAQRGSGAFRRSIESLRRLNAVGYGRTGTGLRLNLAYNPPGVGLPPRQADVEAAYRRELADRFGVTFDRLFALTNMPINRFRSHLLALDAYDEYMERLHAACNPSIAPGVMCRAMVSVAWDGRLYDCDFNQVLGIGIGDDRPQTVAEFDLAALTARRIRFADHCFGCVAGAGSSCGGSLS